MPNKITVLHFVLDEDKASSQEQRVEAPMSHIYTVQGVFLWPTVAIPQRKK